MELMVKKQVDSRVADLEFQVQSFQKHIETLNDTISGLQDQVETLEKTKPSPVSSPSRKGGMKSQISRAQTSSILSSSSTMKPSPSTTASSSSAIKPSPSTTASTFSRQRYSVAQSTPSKFGFGGDKSAKKISFNDADDRNNSSLGSTSSRPTSALNSSNQQTRSAASGIKRPTITARPSV